MIGITKMRTIRRFFGEYQATDYVEEGYIYKKGKQIKAWNGAVWPMRTLKITNRKGTPSPKEVMCKTKERIWANIKK